MINILDQKLDLLKALSSEGRCLCLMKAGFPFLIPKIWQTGKFFFLLFIALKKTLIYKVLLSVSDVVFTQFGTFDSNVCSVYIYLVCCTVLYPYHNSGPDRGGGFSQNTRGETEFSKKLKI